MQIVWMVVKSDACDGDSGSCTAGEEILGLYANEANARAAAAEWANRLSKRALRRCDHDNERLKHMATWRRLANGDWVDGYEWGPTIEINQHEVIVSLGSSPCYGCGLDSSQEPSVRCRSMADGISFCNECYSKQKLSDPTP